MFNEVDVTQGVCGGVLIAAASSLNLLVYGRVTGLSGMLNAVREGLLEPSTWKESFLTGMVIPAVVAQQQYGSGYGKYTFFDNEASTAASLGGLGWSLSGLLVGYGTKLANGCTSGHGVCGLPRFSERSLAAVLTFCASGFATRYLVSSLPKVQEVLSAGSIPTIKDYPLGTRVLLGALVARTLYTLVAHGGVKERLFSLADGALFGCGLLFSGMLRASKVKGFLTLTRDGFDPQLMFVLGTVVMLNVVLFSLILQRNRPMEGFAFDTPSKAGVTNDILVGSVLFGAGWAIAGLCPGPAIISLFTSQGAAHVGVWMAAALAGQYLAVQSAGKLKFN